VNIFAPNVAYLFDTQLCIGLNMLLHAVFTWFTPNWQKHKNEFCNWLGKHCLEFIDKGLLAIKHPSSTTLCRDWEPCLRNSGSWNQNRRT